MRVIEKVNPFRCRMWDLHDRMDGYVNEETCKNEIVSIEKHGQLVPALARPLRGDPEHDLELIYGARRLFVARHLNLPLTVEIREMSDRQAIVAMDIENRHRKDISPYERGMSYAHWLRVAHFSSQEDISRALKVSASQVSRLLKLARLPSVVVEAFGSATEICEKWGLDLVEALEAVPSRSAIVARARALRAIDPRMPSAEVYRQLLAASAGGRIPKRQSHDQVVKGTNGESLFRIRHRRSAVAFLLPSERVSAAVMAKIQSAITEILQPPRAVEPAGATPIARPLAIARDNKRSPQPDKLVAVDR